MNRFGAFLVHLGISLVIFAALAAVVIFVWYPDFFFTTDGGWQGIRIIAMVDVVLGPTLTLIVFDRRKPELKRDLTIIGVIQAVCLAGGVYVVYSERPLALVYVDGQFNSMSAHSYTDAGLAVPDLSRFPGPYPKRLVVKIPGNLEKQSEIRRDALARHVPLRNFSDLYEPYSYDDLHGPQEAIPIANLKQMPDGSSALAKWVSEHAGGLEDYAFFRFGARYDYTLLGVSRHDHEIAGLLGISLVDTDQRQSGDRRQTVNAP